MITKRTLLKTASLGALSIGLLSAPVFAQEDAYIEDRHYITLDKKHTVSTGDKIEVLELFWYRCPHCYSLEEPLKKWLKNDKPANAEYMAFPATLNPSWARQTRIFYTLEALGIREDNHEKVFYAIHGEKKPLNNAEQLADWLVTIDPTIDKETVIETFDSFAVNTKVDYAAKKSRDYGVSSVPYIIIDGRYGTNASMAGGATNLFKIVNYLVEKAAAER